MRGATVGDVLMLASESPRQAACRHLEAKGHRKIDIPPTLLKRFCHKTGRALAAKEQRALGSVMPYDEGKECESKGGEEKGGESKGGDDVECPHTARRRRRTCV